MTRLTLIAAVLVGVADATSTAARHQGEPFFERLKSTTDIAWLEAIAGDESTAEAVTPPNYLVGPVRSMSYVRLGVLGTPEAIAALRRIEAASARASLVPPTVSLERDPHPAPHVSAGYYEPFVRTEGPSGRVFGLIQGVWLGTTDIFVVEQTGDQKWTRPLKIERRFYRGIESPTLTWRDPDQLVLRFIQQPREPSPPGPFFTPPLPGPPGPQEWVIDLAAVRKDSDGDGFTDIEEKRLGLDPNKTDTDGDGLPDGADSAPAYAPPAAESADAEAVILKKAAFVVYGINRSRSLIFVDQNSRPLQLWGFRGPVLFGVNQQQWMREYDHGYMFVTWTLGDRTADSAVVAIRDYEASLSAASFLVTLKKIGGDWVVVALRMTGIS
jgi:hypothetical protein